jgi:hypothetical protein
VALNGQGIVHFSREKGMMMISMGQFSLRKKIMPAVRRVEFVSERMSYITLASYWFSIIILNAHAQSGGLKVLQRLGLFAPMHYYQRKNKQK